MATKVLPESFFASSALSVASQLLGKYLVRDLHGKKFSSQIIEVEAYVGEKDHASHAHRGKTPRNAVMYGPPGIWYIYFIYGMYDMLNVVCGVSGVPHAVLIRGVRDVQGPGRLTRQFKVDRSFNTKKVHRSTGLWIEDRGIVIPKNKILRRPRVGVTYAGKIWSNKPYRFLLKENN